MLAEGSRNPDLVTSDDKDRLWHSPHFDLPILRRRPQPRLLMLLCVRCVFFAMAVATIAAIALKTVQG